MRCIAACRILSAVLLLSATAAGLPSLAGAAETTTEQRVAQSSSAFTPIRWSFAIFLSACRKDLPSHLNGAVYAETLIRAGGQDGVAFILSTASAPWAPYNATPTSPLYAAVDRS